MVYECYLCTEIGYVPISYLNKYTKVIRTPLVYSTKSCTLHSMNMPETIATGEVVILQEAVKALEHHGLVATIDQERPTFGRTRADALVRIGYGKEAEALYAAEIKRWLTPAGLGPVVNQLRNLGTAALLVTEYATPQVAEKLKELDIQFVDTAGNAYLRGPNFLVWMTGRRAQTTHRPPRAGRAWQPTGVKLIFALLCNPDWIALGYRDLAARAGVANGTVGWVMRELAEQGFLVKTRRRRIPRRLHNRRKLLDRWVEVYTGTFRQTTLLRRYRADTTDWWKNLDTARHDVLLGGEPAAALLTEYLKPGTTTIYTKAANFRFTLEHRLREAPDGDIEVRQRFWPFDYEWQHPNLVPPVLIYADLLATGDARCIETAQRVYDGDLARFFAEA